MALTLRDRILDSTVSTGTGTITLDGLPPSGYEGFDTIGNGNTTYYVIVGRTTGEFEVGIGTYGSAGNTLARTTVLSSSAPGDVKVDFIAGPKDVFVSVPASVLNTLITNNTGDQTITLTGDVTGSGDGSFAATIGNDKVTYAKMQNVAANNRILGRISGAGGDVEELTGANVLSIVGAASSGVNGYLSGSDFTTFNNKQVALVSGTNIKTINSTSVLGSGDIAVQATLVSGTNIKTINSTTILGSGDIAVQATLVSGTNIKTIAGSSILGSGSLGTTVGSAFFNLANPSSITFPKINADNTVSTETPSTFRTSIGATTVGNNLFTLTNPSAISFVKINADNTISTENASTFRTSIGAGTVTSVAAITLGTSGTDLGSTVSGGTGAAVITLNVPTASASNRGALSSTDWTTFNNKQAALSVPTGNLLYRKTAGTGAPEYQTLATLKTDLGLAGTNSGDQTITLTGDVTGTGTGSFATTIANSSVSFAKMQNISTANVLGRVSGSTGAVESLTGTQVVSILPSATTSVTGVLTSTDWTTFNNKQAALVSGTNIKSVGGASLLGSGDLSSFTNNFVITRDSAEIKLTTSSNRGWRFINASTGTTHAAAYIQSSNDGFVSNFMNFGFTPQGNFTCPTILATGNTGDAAVDAQTPSAGGSTGGVRIRGNASNHAYLQFTNAPVNAQWGFFDVTNAGACYWNGGTFYASDFEQSSDARLKNIKGRIDNSLDLLSSLEAFRFKWNGVKENRDKKTHIGLIAQEVEKTLPELVTDHEDGFKTVNYIALIPLLIEAVNELSIKIKELEDGRI